MLRLASRLPRPAARRWLSTSATPQEALLASFVRLPRAHLPQTFLGPLGVLPPNAPLHLVALTDDDRTVRVATPADAAAISGPVVGLAYVLKAPEETTASYWLSPALASVDRPIAQLLRAAAATTEAPLTLTAVPQEHMGAIDAAVQSLVWNDRDPYFVYELDGENASFGSAPVGSTWTDGDDVFEMDTMHPSDVDRLVTMAEVPYDPAYIKGLVEHPLLSRFTRVIRLQSSGLAISSCLVHRDFSIGMTRTDPKFARRGLVLRAIQATLDAVRDYAQDDGAGIATALRPYASVRIDNAPALKMMDKIGCHLASNSPFYYISVVV